MAKDCKDGQVRIILREGGVSGGSLRYLRSYAGLTVKQALNKVEEGDIPGNRRISAPYYLNGQHTWRFGNEILKTGDVLSVYDP